MALSAADRKAIAEMIAGAVAPAVEAPAPKPVTRKSRKAASPVVSCITAEIAWNLLGADPKYAPKSEANAQKPASNAQLWKLNSLGLLDVVTR